MDGVWHLAFVNGTEFFYSKPELVLDIGVKGMVNVLEGCIRHDVSELFLASSSEVYQTPPAVPTDETVPFSVPDPLNPRYSYGGGKIISELMTINYGRKHFDRALIFRPHNVYGPDMGWEHVIPQFAMRLIELCGANSGKHIFFPIQGTGAETRAFIFIDDFIDGLMLLRERGEHLGIYHVGTMEEVTISQVAGQIAAYFGRDITLIPGKLAAGGTVRRCPDIKKIRRLGFSPKVSLAEGVIATMKWYDENAHKRSRMRTGE
jgi:nucleoside-diphosphate-sugar epimerase